MGALLAALRGRRDTRGNPDEQQQTGPSRVTEQDKAVLVSLSHLVYSTSTVRVLIIARIYSALVEPKDH